MIRKLSAKFFLFFWITLFFSLITCSTITAQGNQTSTTRKANELAAGVENIATIVGIAGGLIALYKYFYDKREQEILQWQKVAIYEILLEDELGSLKFSTIKEKYRNASIAVEGLKVNKKEISEDALRRILLDLKSSGIISILPSDSFKLNVEVPKPDLQQTLDIMNKELVRLVSPNPYVYSVDEIAKEMSATVGMEIPIIRNELLRSVQLGLLFMDEKGCLAFPHTKDILTLSDASNNR